MIIAKNIRPFFLLSFVFSVFSSCSQPGNTKPGKLTDRVVNFYNQQAYDSIFYLFSAEMKAALPLQQTTEFFSGLQTDAGRIEKYKFEKKGDGFDHYKAFFSKAVFQLSIAEDAGGKISGLLFTPYTETTRNQTKMSLPFNGEWLVFWGGDTKEQNYHVISRAQKNAFDIVMVDKNNRPFKTDGKLNEDYYAFGQPLIAPCDATVVTVINGVKENIPGEMNPGQVTGNTVVLKTAANEYILFAHFKLNSIQVKTGDPVKKGQLLGLCGNSGNSSEPHLHFHIQDKESMTGSTGIKCFFDSLLVNGVLKTDYSPVKGERIKNAQ